MNLESNVNKSLVDLEFSDFYRLRVGLREYNERVAPCSLNPHYSELLPIIRRNRMVLRVFRTAAILLSAAVLYKLSQY